MLHNMTVVEEETFSVQNYESSSRVMKLIDLRPKGKVGCVGPIFERRMYLGLGLTDYY